MTVLYKSISQVNKVKDIYVLPYKVRQNLLTYHVADVTLHWIKACGIWAKKNNFFVFELFYLILLCHFITQNQKLRCSPETFRLSFYGIQGVPKKIWAQSEPRFWKSVVETKNFPLDLWRTGMSKAQFFWDILDTIKA